MICNNEYPKLARNNKLSVIITDLVCYIEDKKYHIECQNVVDKSMVIRMFEYDTEIALRDSYFSENDITKLVVPFPDPAILYLRSTEAVPEEYSIEIVTSGGSIVYKVPVLDVTKYNTEDIFSKDVLFLLPFFLFRYESKFEKANQGSLDLQVIITEYKQILTELNYMRISSSIDPYTVSTLVDMLYSVASTITEKYANLRMELFSMVKEEVLKFEFTTLYEEGYEKGVGEGYKKGVGEGYEKGVDDIISKLLSKGKSKYEIANMLDISIDTIERLLTIK